MQESTIIGYSSVKQKVDEIVRLLRLVATLIAEKGEQVINMSETEQIRPGLNFINDANLLHTRANDLAEGVFTIMVLGDFNHGKSTLLNALLGQEMLPSAATPTTAVITILTYGDDDQVRLYERNRAEPHHLGRDEFIQGYILDTKDARELEEYRLQNIEYAHIYCTHSFCQKGIKLVDSPGLGEHIKRSEIATNYLKNAHAVIFLLNATRLLSAEEREFIQFELGSSHLDYVFFIVNKIDQVKPADIPDLERRARYILGKHFMGENRQLDESLFSQRVYFVNALGALTARQLAPENTELLEKSGFLAFEHGLENFLTDEQMFQASVSASLQVLLGILRRVDEYIARQKDTLDQPLEALRTRRDVALQELQLLEKQRQAIEQLIIQAGEKVQVELEIDLTHYIDHMRADWAQDIPSLIDRLKDVRSLDILVSAVKSATRERIAQAVQKAIEAYLNDKFQIWSEQASQLAGQEIKVLQERLQTEVTAFENNLTRIRQAFATGDEAILSAEQQQITIELTNSFLVGGQGVIGIIYGALRRFYIVVALFYIGTLSLFLWALLIAAIAAEIGLITDNESRFKRSLLERLGKIIYQNLSSDIRTTDIVASNIRHLKGLVKALTEPDTLLDQFLWANLSSTTQEAIAAYASPGPKDGQLRQMLADDLSRLTHGEVIYTPERFAGISLTDETRRLLTRELHTDERWRLNRRLLVEAYPEILAPKLKDLLYQNIQQQFVALAQTTTQNLQDKIQEVRNWMDNTIHELEDEEFSIAQEKERLDGVSHHVYQTVNEISLQAYNRVHTVEKLEAMAKISQKLRQR